MYVKLDFSYLFMFNNIENKLSNQAKNFCGLEEEGSGGGLAKNIYLDKVGGGSIISFKTTILLVALIL